ncbi:hypothetical protein [Nocardioides sp. LHG3406-4]|uniref:hypothetical protein n=1 Tax=Nocardioides sp. LHG3406-4 TaxID=2804575 RepID=UPI003CF97A05
MAGLSLVVVSALVVGGTLLLRDDTYRVPIQRGGAAAGERPSARPALASSALHALEHAVQSGDATAVASLAPDVAARALLAAVVANSRDLHVEDFSMRYVDEIGATEPDGSWRAAVDLTWAFAGFDRSPAAAEVVVGFVPIGDGVGIASLGDASSTSSERRSPVWLGQRVHVVRAEGILVLAAESRRVARTYADRLRAAYPVVRAVLPRWRPSVVVEVPPSAAALDAALGSPRGSYEAVAAVTTTVDGSQDDQAPVHVLVNPDVSGRLRSQGAQIVMTHEVVHVATGAALSPMPLWLLEGFADYVALREVRLPLSVTAARIARQVRREGPPDRLPGAEEFDPSAEGLEAVYESAWLACVVLADQVGEDGLKEVYRDADSGTAPRAALRRAGIGQRHLVRLWRERLQDLAS